MQDDKNNVIPLGKIPYESLQNISDNFNDIRDCSYGRAPQSGSSYYQPVTHLIETGTDETEYRSVQYEPPPLEYHMVINYRDILVYWVTDH